MPKRTLRRLDPDKQDRVLRVAMRISLRLPGSGSVGWIEVLDKIWLRC